MPQAFFQHINHESSWKGMPKPNANPPTIEGSREHDTYLSTKPEKKLRSRPNRKPKPPTGRPRGRPRKNP